MRQYYSTSHDFNGRKVKKKAVGGERYKKHPSQDFKPIADAPVRVMRGDTTQYKSVDSDQSKGACVGPKYNKYTGTLIKGISVLHKSNAIPILNKEEIIDIARMRG